MSAGLVAVALQGQSYANEPRIKVEQRPTVRAIIDRLRTDRSEEGVSRALAPLKAIGPAQGRELCEYVFDADELVARTAQEAVVSIGEPVAHHMTAYFSSSDGSKRVKAIQIAGIARVRSACIDLVLIRNHPDPDTRLAVVDSLGQIRDRRAILPLLDVAYKDDNLTVREAALDAVGLFEATAVDAVPALYELLRDVDRRGDPAELVVVGASIFYALGKIGPPSLPTLCLVLDAHGPRSAECRGVLLGALSRMSVDAGAAGARDLATALLTLMETDNPDLSLCAGLTLSAHPGLAKLVVDRLKKLAGKGAAPVGVGLCLVTVDAGDAMGKRVLARALTEGSVQERSIAFFAIQKYSLSGPDIKNAVGDVLRSADRDGRLAAIQTIRTSLPDEVEMLRTAIQRESDEEVIEEAKRVLNQLEKNRRTRAKK